MDVTVITQSFLSPPTFYYENLAGVQITWKTHILKTYISTA